MPIVDIPLVPIGAPVDTPKGFFVTPGEDDLNHGSDVPDDRKTWASSFGAAFRQDNIVGNILSSEPVPDRREVEDGFNPWDKIKGTKYEAHWDSFVDVNNTPALEATQRKIDREEEDRKTLEAVSWKQAVPAQIIASAFDLPTLLPGGTIVTTARAAAMRAAAREAAGFVPVKGGFAWVQRQLDKGWVRSLGSVGVAGGIATSVQESALHSLEETRPMDETPIIIGASVFLSGLCGLAGAKLFG